MAGIHHVTIRSVADRASVSTATVSRALSGKTGVGEDTRERVLRIAQELGYRGDPSARALRSRNSNIYGVVVPDISNPFFPKLVQSLERRVETNDHELLIADSQNDFEVENRRVQALVGRRIDALFISPVHRFESRKVIEWAADRIPVIQIDRKASALTPYVGVNQASALEKVVEHLTGRGRKRIGYLGYSGSASTSHERLTAFRRITENWNVPGHSLLVDDVHSFQREIQEWLVQHNFEFDAFIAASDVHAMALRMELEKSGVEIPKHVAIVSFDNTQLALAAGLTSYKQPLSEMANFAVDMVEGEADTSSPIIVSGALIERASSVDLHSNP